MCIRDRGEPGRLELAIRYALREPARDRVHFGVDARRTPGLLRRALRAEQPHRSRDRRKEPRVASARAITDALRFEHDDVRGRVLLPQPDRRGKPGEPGPDDGVVDMVGKRGVGPAIAPACVELPVARRHSTIAIVALSPRDTRGSGCWRAWRS